MSAQSVLLKPTGLFTHPSHLSAVPQGALLTANNVVINRDNIIESRRGHKIYGTAMGSSTSNTAHQLLNYKGRILRHYGTGSGTTLESDSNGTGTFTPFQLVLSGNISSGSPTVSSISSTAQLFVGMFVSGVGIPANTSILSITDNNTIVLSANATATTAPVALTFTYKIEEVVLGTRIKSIEQNSNLYFTTAEGIKKISASSAANLAASVITNAGGVKALGLKADINNSSGFFSPSSVTAYRLVWGIKDANQNLILGAPSERVVIRNTDNTNSKTVDLTVTIPREITGAHFYQLYRTAVIPDVSTFSFLGDLDSTIDNTTIKNISSTTSLTAGMNISGTGLQSGTTILAISSATSILISKPITVSGAAVTITVTQNTNQDPGDEQGLVFESNPTTSELNAGVLLITDITPDSFRGANLYTNANSGEGILQANDVPPVAQDIATFKGYTFYANTKTKQRLNLSLLSISALVSGTSTLTVTDGTTSNVYTFKTQSITCDTHSTNIVDGIASTSTLTVGASISGSDFLSGTYIVRIISATSIEISQSATGSNTATSFTTGYESVSLKYIAISQFATPGQQVDETARSLVRIINSEDSEIVYGFYISGVDDVPGAMLFEARQPNQIAFYVFANSATTTGTQFNPNLPASGNLVTSDNESSPNRIYYSKFQQPEAVPLLNYVDIGPRDKQIKRILALRDNLFVLKEEGIYRLSGFTAPFQIYPFDFSTSIQAADSAVILNNLIYVYSDQGIATISDTNVNIISRPIEDKILNLLSPSYTNLKTATFGVSYESDRSYYLFTVSQMSDTFATQCFRFNTFTNSWTILTISKRSGIVNFADNKLYLSPIDTNFIEQERKNFDRTDYADRQFDLSLGGSSVNGTSIILSSFSDVTVGDVIVQTQYLTLSQFNRILTKLDRDSLLSDSNYSASLNVSSGALLNTALDNLISKIANDAGRLAISSTPAVTYTNLSPVNTAFIDIQTAFNAMVTLLNADTGVGYSTYSTSTGTTDYEFPVLTLTKATNTITTIFDLPLMQGPIVAYNHIEAEAQFVPQVLTDTSITKQASEGTYIFEDNSFTQATVSYSSDLSADFEDTIINGNGPGLFGTNLYGQGIFGGNGSGIPFRTYIPREKQRCRYMNVKFTHLFAREIFSLYGISLTYTPTSQRGWR